MEREEMIRPVVKRITDPLERQKALQVMRQRMSEKYGEELIMSAAAKEELRVQALPSGILSLDVAMGIGGYPRGRLIEVFGAESSGKTTVALYAVAQAQKLGGIAAYIDVENSLDPEYAQNIGVNLDDLIFSQPDSGEKAFDALEELVRTGALDLIVIDSVAALAPQIEIDGVALRAELAKMMPERLKRIVALVNKTKTVVLFINQVRANLSGFLGTGETTPGGKALKFYSSVRVEVKTLEKIKQGELVIGKKTNMTTVKNKVATPFKKATVDNVWGEGFAPALDIVANAVRVGVVQQSGQWYSFEGQKIGKGIFEVKDYLKAHPKVLQMLEAGTREQLGFLENEHR
ncbi:recombinase RecA [Lactococcus lactis subsp. lactis]|uniref:Protein RecA n=1 Tax=Lactococcus cremoris subsp. cremoris TIFN6 TaxID=1234876 RepID=T0SH11_LACLC|nr:MULTISPECIES: recombinase RecA [Lactococcus]EQC58212.1 recombinase RecA [Lactococcus cremoris subsp. cremoris TIFN6]AEU40738.1 RecA protein [Lactococcus cremoris subsp. cremoris A76]MBR8673884.1 recombinase RecA [Lactococcus lactis subsp. lactis]MBR8676699.1 recombinase RecA [Lactococcus lactis subsp. lactis]MBR8684185.1 recombinase RecA [Lactococcus lactis subsp. lactis]